MTQYGNFLTKKRSTGQVLLDIVKFIGFIILSVVPTTLIIALMNMQDQISMAVKVGAGVVWLLLVVALIAFLSNRYHRYAKEKMQSIGWRDIGIALLFFLVARVIAIGGTYLIQWMYGEEMTANDEAIDSITNSDSTFTFYLVLFALTIGITGPIVEEFVFRGIGANLLFKKHVFWLPLIITSAIFGLMHTPTHIISFLLYGLIGVILFLAYNRRRNILDSILVHILNNILSAILLLVA